MKEPYPESAHWRIEGYITEASGASTGSATEAQRQSSTDEKIRTIKN